MNQLKFPEWMLIKIHVSKSKIHIKKYRHDETNVMILEIQDIWVENEI